MEKHTISSSQHAIKRKRELREFRHMVWDANPGDPSQFALRGGRRHQRISHAKIRRITLTQTTQDQPFLPAYWEKLLA